MPDTPSRSPTAAELAAALARYRILAATEARLQEAFAAVAAEERWTALREARLGPRDVPDFFFPDTGLVVECKVAGHRAAVERQLARYAEHAAVRALALLTTRRTHAGVAPTLNGKPVTVVHVGGAFR